MARKTYLNSFRKTNLCVNKSMISSKNSKLATKAVNSLLKRKARQKFRRRSKKCERKVFSEDCKSNASGSLVTFKVCRKKRPVSVDQGAVEVLDTFSLRSDAVETFPPSRESVMECGWCDNSTKQIVSTTSLFNPDVADCPQVWSITTATDFPKTWTEEMIRYYFEPNEKRRDFDYVKIMDNIEYKASDWWISDADRENCRKRKDFFLRCSKCNQKGHSKKECKKHVVCYVCGEFNHWFSNCPNTMCLTCGRATKKYSNTCRHCRRFLTSRKSCALCGQIWHEESLCPSKWRKYLMVTRSSCDAAIRLNPKKYCYNCAQSGHFGFECPLLLESDYPPENPLKTAFPLEQEFCAKDHGGHEGKRDHKNSSIVDNDGNFDISRVHVIFLAEQTCEILSSETGKHFLSDLSRSTNIRIELFRGKRSYIKLFGDDEIVNYCKTELLKWKKT